MSNSVSSGPYKIDLTDPTIGVDLTPAAATTGWYNIATGAPTADYTCNDVDGDGDAANGGASGIAPDPDGCTPDHTFGEGENQSHEGTATDNAGRSDQTPASVSNVDVDLTQPSLGNIVTNNAASSNVCTTSSAPTQPTGFAASDGLSGINEQARRVRPGRSQARAPIPSGHTPTKPMQPTLPAIRIATARITTATPTVLGPVGFPTTASCSRST